MTAETKTVKKERPLSPHLQVYRPQMTSVLSILHRATGVFMAIASVLLLWWLVAAATGAEYYEIFAGYMHSKLALLVLLGVSFSFFYHFCNGIRHLIWDTARMMEIDEAKKAGYVVFYSAVGLTALLWYGLFEKGIICLC